MQLLESVQLHCISLSCAMLIASYQYSNPQTTHIQYARVLDVIDAYTGH